MEAAQPTAHRAKQEEGEDLVEREIDVYINRIDDASFSVLQYPLRPIYRPYGDQGQLRSIGYRKQQKTFHFTYDINTKSENFEDLYESSDKSIAGKSDILETLDEPRETVKHQLKSQEAKSSNCSYAVGLLKDNCLFITPVSNILQFRPNFNNVDKEQQTNQQKAENKIKEAADSNLLAQTTRNETPLPTNRVGPIHPTSSPTVNPKPPAAGSTSASNENETVQAPTTAHSDTPKIVGNTENRSRIAHSRLRDAEEEESWEPIQSFYDSQSQEAYEITNLLCNVKEATLCSSQEAVGNKQGVDNLFNIEEKDDKRSLPELQFVEDFDSYLDYLCSMDGSGFPNSKNKFLEQNSTGALSYLALSKLPVEQQVLRILKNRNVESFSNVMRLLTKGVSVEALITILKEFGTLVMGNWVIKSHLVYEDYEVYCRDFILCLLSRQEGKPGLAKEHLKNSGILPMERITIILNEVGKYDSTGWQFKLPRDIEFCKEHPDLVKESEAYWAERLNVVISEIYKRKDTQQNTLSQSRREYRELLKQCELLLRNKGAHTLHEIKVELEKLGLSSVKELPDSELSSSLSTIALEIGHVWVIQQLGNDRLDKYREVLISMFRNYDQPLTKAAILEEFKSVLHRRFDLPDFLFRKLLREFSYNIQGRWVLKGTVTKPDIP